MSDTSNLPDAPETVQAIETIERLNRLNADLEATRNLKRRLLTHEDEARYWLSDEAMQHD